MRFFVLGPVEAQMNDCPVRLAGGRPRAMLATLLFNEGRVCPADRIIDAIWGTDPPSSAPTQLHIVASRLRAAMQAAGCPPEENVITRSPGYLLRAGRCDLYDFRTLAVEAAEEAGAGRWRSALASYRAALSLWRGRACMDVTAPGVVVAAGALDTERTAVTERCLATALLAGAYDDVLVEATRLLVAEPLRERLYYLLMAAHALAGRAADALAVYRSARSALTSELGLEPGSELSALEREVLRGEQDSSARILRRWAANKTGSATGTDPGTSGPAPVPVGLVHASQRPWELPADIPDFVGRPDELARIGEALTARQGGSGAPALVSISGLGGVGKTALAVRAARRFRSLYPDGCLFASMGGGQDTPHEASAVLGSLLRSLGIPGPAVPDDLQARVGLYRSVLSDRRLLVVLDDALDERHVRPLLPPSGGSAAVITSRRSLSGLDAVTTVGLDVLTHDDATELLSRLVDRDWRDDERASVHQLVGLCGRLPLALRVVGARLSHRADLSPERLAHRLVDERSRLSELSSGDRDIRACLTASYRRLAPPAARLLRLTAALPTSTFPLRVVAALAGGDPQDAERHLDQLVEAQLVQAPQLDLDGSPRYVVHDLVRLFAAERLAAEERPADRDEALRRGYRSLLAHLAAADAVLPSRMFPVLREPDPAPLADTDPLAWFEQERPLLAAAVSHTTALGWWELAWRFAAAGTNAADLSGCARDWDDAISGVLTALGDTRTEPAAVPALLLCHGLLLRACGREEAALPVCGRPGGATGGWATPTAPRSPPPDTAVPPARSASHGPRGAFCAGRSTGSPTSAAPTSRAGRT